MQNPRELTPEEFLEWTHHPTTVAVRWMLRAWTAELGALWVSGQYTDQTADGTLQRNSEAIGMAQGFKRILDLSLEDINEEISNERNEELVRFASLGNRRTS